MGSKEKWAKEMEGGGGELAVGRGGEGQGAWRGGDVSLADRTLD